MGVRACEALPRVITHLESFVYTKVQTEAGIRRVTLVERFWVYEDDTWQRTTHLANDPMIGDNTGDEPLYDPEKCAFLRGVAERISALTSVASAVAALLIVAASGV